MGGECGRGAEWRGQRIGGLPLTKTGIFEHMLWQAEFWVPEVKQWREQMSSLFSGSLPLVAGTERRVRDEIEIYGTC